MRKTYIGLWAQFGRQKWYPHCYWPYKCRSRNLLCVRCQFPWWDLEQFGSIHSWLHPIRKRKKIEGVSINFMSLCGQMREGIVLSTVRRPPVSFFGLMCLTIFCGKDSYFTWTAFSDVVEYQKSIFIWRISNSKWNLVVHIFFLGVYREWLILFNPVTFQFITKGGFPMEIKPK